MINLLLGTVLTSHQPNLKANKLAKKVYIFKCLKSMTFKCLMPVVTLKYISSAKKNTCNTYSRDVLTTYKTQTRTFVSETALFTKLAQ